MKLFKIFNKTPNYKKFNYSPRFYNQEEEERKERISRIEREFTEKKESESSLDAGMGYRDRMQGSFRQARQASGGSSNTSSTLLRFGLLLVLTLGLIGYLQYGKPALYGLAFTLIPLFLYSRLRNYTKKNSN